MRRRVQEPWWLHVAFTAILVVFWPLVMLALLSREGEWQAGNVILGGLFHAAMWAGIAFWAGWLP